MNERSRTWNLLLYPNEDDSHYKAYQYIINFYTDYAYIIHDKDINKKNELKKEHYHFTIQFRNARFKNAIATELGITSNYIQKCNSLENSLKYLIHYNIADKYQYSIEEVQGSLKKKLIQILDNNESTESEKLLSIIQYINSYYGYLTYHNLLVYLCNTPLLSTYKKYAYSINTIVNEHNLFYTSRAKEKEEFCKEINY